MITTIDDVTADIDGEQRAEPEREPRKQAAAHTNEPYRLPNGARLSCAAVLWFSQLQFYYDGRRQLQPLVRLRTDIRSSEPALERN